MSDVLTGKLTKLKELNVSFNKLKSIPPELGNCESLESLNLSNNLELAELPFEVMLLHYIYTCAKALFDHVITAVEFKLLVQLLTERNVKCVNVVPFTDYLSSLSMPHKKKLRILLCYFHTCNSPKMNIEVECLSE